MHWYLDVLKNYAEFKGRTSRKGYWMFILINFCIVFTVGFIMGLLHFGTNAASTVNGLYNLAILIPAIAVGVRRMHDTGRSGWWLIVPFAGLIFACQRSQPFDNAYGAYQAPAGENVIAEKQPV